MILYTSSHLQKISFQDLLSEGFYEEVRNLMHSPAPTARYITQLQGNVLYPYMFNILDLYCHCQERAALIDALDDNVDIII